MVHFGLHKFQFLSWFGTFLGRRREVGGSNTVVRKFMMVLYDFFELFSLFHIVYCVCFFSVSNAVYRCCYKDILILLGYVVPRACFENVE